MGRVIGPVFTTLPSVIVGSNKRDRQKLGIMVSRALAMMGDVK
jgi:hypothetical protein